MKRRVVIRKSNNFHKKEDLKRSVLDGCFSDL
jgi:hypothetical protein